MIVRNLKLGSLQTYNGVTVRIVGVEASREKDTFDVTLGVDGRRGHKTLLNLTGGMEFECGDVEWRAQRRRKKL